MFSCPVSANGGTGLNRSVSLNAEDQMTRMSECRLEVNTTSLVASWLFACAVCVSAEVEVSPATVQLNSPEASQQLLVTASVSPALGNASPHSALLRSVDLSRAVTYRVVDSAIAEVTPEGLVVPCSEGQTEVIVSPGSDSTEEAKLSLKPFEPVRITVIVSGMVKPVPISFEQQIIPVLTKSGCNTGGCHGKSGGQNGFALSVFGHDPLGDYDSIVRNGRGRRISPAMPDHSLLIRKALARVPHGGGRKVEPDSALHQRFRRWIVEGASFSSAEVKPIVAIEVEPKHRVLNPGGTQQLRVTGIDENGRRRCVTTEAEFLSNAETIATVDERGWVQVSDLPGEVAISVRYMEQVAVSHITLPQQGQSFPRPPEHNFVDRLVWDKLELLGIPPSDIASDSEFLRRVYLDTIGTLPTSVEARKFIEDSNPEKRQALIDELLDRPEYADFWAMRWADLLRVDRDALTPRGAVAMDRWLRKSFASNRPYDEFVRKIVAARGRTLATGPASFYKALTEPDVVARSVSQLFLGVRIECAQCHHHPSDRWGQDDYYALAGFFTGVQRKSVPIGGEAVFSKGGDNLKHPRTDEPVPTRALGAPLADFTQNSDRRDVLAAWMTSADNPFLTRSLANRLWAHYFGRGLVEPIDDMRATNPATNEPLLDALAQHVHDVRFDLKAFTRTLLNSRAYQLSSETNELNNRDLQNYSHALDKALAAEVLLDAICQVTGVPEKFNGWPHGYRAIEIWDNRMPSYFFRVFGRPLRTTVCECERSNEPSISQALHLMNSPEVSEKIESRTGIVRKLATSELSPELVVDDLYLSALARFPTPPEKRLMLDAFSLPGRDRQTAAEDVIWSLLNSREFIYNH